MPKYGVHAFLLEGSWDNQIAPKVIAEAAELGFDLIEIPLLKPDEFDSALIAKLLSENKLEGDREKPGATPPSHRLSAYWPHLTENLR